MRRSCTQCVGTMSQPHTCLWYHGRGTSPEAVPALLAVAPRPSKVLLQPPLLVQCGLSTPHRCCASPKVGVLLQGDQELQPHTRGPTAELCGAGRNPPPTPGRHHWHTLPARASSGIPAASRCHHHLPHSCARTPSPRPVCRARHPGLSHPAASAGDGRPTIAHKGRMSPPKPSSGSSSRKPPAGGTGPTGRTATKELRPVDGGSE